MKGDEWENLKSNMYAINAAIGVILQEEKRHLLSCSKNTHRGLFEVNVFVHGIIPVELHR